MTLGARRLLAAVDTLPVRVPERERLVQALDLVASTEWTRVLVRLPQVDVESLSVAGLSFEQHALGHVLEVADTLASVYSFDFVEVAHIAISLALTRKPVGRDVTPVIAEAFGLGTLDRLNEVMNQHALRKEATEDPSPAEPPRIGFTIVGGRWKRAVVGCYLAVVATAVVVLVVHAVRTGSFVAWLVVGFTIVSSRDSRETKVNVAERVGWGRIPLRWPIQGVLAVLAVVLGDPVVAVILVAQFLVTELVVVVGEAILSRHDCFTGPGFEGVPFSVRRLLSVPDAYITGQRALALALTLALAAVPTAVVAWATGSAWALCVLAAVLVTRGLSGFASIVLVITVLAGGLTWVVLVAVAGGLVARLAVTWSRRPPVAPVPVPRRGVPGVRVPRGEDARAFRRARRLLRRGLPGGATQVLADHATSHPVLIALHGWALVQSGRVGTAEGLVRDLPEALASVRGLVTGLARMELSQPRPALAAINAVTAEVGRGRAHRELVVELRLAWLRARVALGERGLSVPMARMVPRTVRRSRLLDAMVTIRLVAQGDPDYSRDAVMLVASSAFLLHRWVRDGREVRFFTLLGAERVLDLEGVRAAAVVCTADISPNVGGLDAAEALGGGTGVAEFLLRLDRPLEAATVLNRLADHLETTPNRLGALDARVEAAAALHWTRHQLDDLATRRLWWARAGDTLEKAMRQAVEGRDWATLAELIETARLQLAPREGEDVADLTGAPFIRVRGVSRLAGSLWYRSGERPPCYDLERLADVVLGPATWWWSTWSTETQLYWALVRPDGEVSGGVEGIGPDTDLGMALGDLRVAAPAPWPGESMGDERFQARMADSVLFGPREAESDLARRLAGLLPPRLRERLAAGGEPVNLAVAPARVLATVPWALVGTGVGDVRLVERCRLAIAPPAGLLAVLAKRSRHDGDHPLSLAVLNPGGALGSARHDLGAASALGYGLPDGVRTITRFEDTSLDEFGTILRSLPARSSVVFACHTNAGTGAPLSAGLQLHPPTSDRPAVVLSAGALIDSPDRYPVPRQGLVLACDSADLGRAGDGEWLVLGTALLWAGAQRLVVTGFPVVDSDAVDRPLLDHLLAGDDLVDSLRAIQIDRLAWWRASGSEEISPAIWGAHTALGAFTPRTVVPDADAVAGRFVDESFIELLDSAAEHAGQMGRPEVTPTDLLHALAIYGFTEEAPLARRLVLNGIAYSWAIVALSLARLRRLPAAPKRSATLRADTMDVVHAACAIAGTARHRLLTTEHLLVAALAGTGTSAAVARWLSHGDGRHPEVVKEIISESQDGLRALSLPEVKHLAPHVVRAVYTAYAVEPPMGKSDRVRLSDA